MGAKVSGHGSGTITIEGVQNLKSANYTPIGDRIEAATYIMTGLMMNNEINVTGFVPQHLDAVIDVLKEMGGELEVIASFPEGTVRISNFAELGEEKSN